MTIMYEDKIYGRAYPFIECFLFGPAESSSY